MQGYGDTQQVMLPQPVIYKLLSMMFVAIFAGARIFFGNTSWKLGTKFIVFIAMMLAIYFIPAGSGNVLPGPLGTLFGGLPRMLVMAGIVVYFLFFDND